MGLNTLPCSVDVAIACWPWGAYLGDDAVTKGVRMKISSWTRHDHNTMPPASKTTGNYVNSSLAKVEALKAGYDEAIMLNPQGLVVECTGENIFVRAPRHAHHAAAVAPARSRASRSDGDGASPPTSASRSSSATSPAATSTSPRRCSCAAPPPRSRAVNSVDDRADPVPGPDDHGHRREVRQGRPRPGRPSTRTGSNMSADLDADSRSVEIFDTTLRDGAQLEGISLTVDDKLRIAEQLDWLGVHYIEGGCPQANPKDEEFFRRARTELQLRDGRAGRVRLDPPAARARSTTTRRCRPSSRPARRRCASSASRGTSTSTEALRHRRSTRAWRWSADSVRFLRAEGLRVFFDAEHFFDGYKANPEFTLRVLEAAATDGAEVLVLCDTNGGSLPHEVRAHRRRGRALLRRRRQRSASTPRTTPAAPSANSLAAVVGRGHAGAGHDQRLRRAHRQRQPHDVHPQPRAEDGHRGACPRAGSSGSPR